MKKVRKIYGHRKIPKLIYWYMKMNNYDGYTLINTIYYISEFPSEALERHEMCHIKQIYRDGVVKFHIKYLWYWITRGYRNNPYEVEARKYAMGHKDKKKTDAYIHPLGCLNK